MSDKTPLEISQEVNEMLKGRIQNYRNLVESMMERYIEAAAEKVGTVRPEAIKDLLARGKEIFTVTEDGVSIEARNKQGVLLFGKGGVKPISIDEWAVSLKKTAPHLWEPEKKGQAGGQATNLEAQLAEAKERKDIQGQIRLKRLIHEARQAV